MNSIEGVKMAKMGKIEKWFMNRPKHNLKAANKAERLLQHVDFKGNQKFLEVGCGNGTACKYIAEKYSLNVTGVDVDPEQIQNAIRDIEKIQNIQFFEGDSTNLKFSDNEYDIVYSSGVLHHIGNWKKVLDEAPTQQAVGYLPIGLIDVASGDSPQSLQAAGYLNDFEIQNEINRVLKSKGYYIFSDLAYSRFTTRVFKNIAKNYGVYNVGDIIDSLIRIYYHSCKNNKETLIITSLK